MPAPIHAKVVIIGSGPAGYTAAIYAARAMLEPVLIQGIQPGGQLTITTDVENYPGFADVIQGPWLMEQMEKQAAHVGTKIVIDLVTKLDLSQRPFRLSCDSGDIYLAETSFSPPARRRAGSARRRRKNSRASACRPARPATDSFIAARKSWWSAAATPRSRKRSFSPISPRRSPSCIVAITSAPSGSCRSACSSIPRSRWSGTARSTKSAAPKTPAKSPMSGSRMSKPAH